jgi:hypothetical protein
VKALAVRYKVKPEHAERNRELIRAVFAELEATAPARMQYASFELEDGLTFMHVHAVDDDATSPLHALAAFQAFRKDMGDRCTEQPVSTDLHEVCSYGWLVSRGGASDA